MWVLKKILWNEYWMVLVQSQRNLCGVIRRHNWMKIFLWYIVWEMNEEPFYTFSINKHEVKRMGNHLPSLTTHLKGAKYKITVVIMERVIEVTVGHIIIYQLYRNVSTESQESWLRGKRGERKSGWEAFYSWPSSRSMWEGTKQSNSQKEPWPAVKTDGPRIPQGQSHSVTTRLYPEADSWNLVLEEFKV